VFCFTVFPPEGWQPVDVFIHGPLSVPARLSRITQYGFRREEDFDKYDALAMAEQLATAAKLSGYEKAPTFDAIACTPREKLPVSKKQFKAYFVALLADKEHAHVLEAVAKMDKCFKSSAPGLASGSSGTSAQASARPTARRPRIFLLRMWFAWPHGFQMF